MGQFEFWWLGCCVAYFHPSGREQFQYFNYRHFFFRFYLKDEAPNCWETSLCHDEDRSSVSGMWSNILGLFFCFKRPNIVRQWRPIWSRVRRRRNLKISSQTDWRTRFYANEPGEFAWPRGAIGSVLFGLDSLLLLPMSGACRSSLDEAIGVSLWPRKSVEPVRKSGTLLRNRPPAFGEGVRRGAGWWGRPRTKKWKCNVCSRWAQSRPVRKETTLKCVHLTQVHGRARDEVLRVFLSFVWLMALYLNVFGLEFIGFLLIATPSVGRQRRAIWIVKMWQRWPRSWHCVGWLIGWFPPLGTKAK